MAARLHVVVLFAAAAAAAVADSAAPACDSGPFSIDGATLDIQDACGRVRIFHGINNVVKGPPYAPDPSRFVPGGGSASAVDAAVLASAGLNAMRLGVMWAGAVPTVRGDVNVTYLQTLVTVVETLAAAGVYALLDAHQDGLSPLFCDDGAPEWWAREWTADAPAFPAPLGPAFPTLPPTAAECGQYAWIELYFTSAVGQGFQNLYNTSAARQDFIDFWIAVVRQFASVPIIGYELLNEPWAGDAVANPLLLLPGVADNETIGPFYDAVGAAVRAAEAAAGVAPRLIWMEPVTWDETIPVGFSPSATAWSSNASVLSYHFYALPDIVGAADQVAARATDARRLHSAGALTEFDVGLISPVNPPYNNTDLRATLDFAEGAAHSTFGWAYGSLFQGDDSGATLYVPALRELARPYAPALAGRAAVSVFNATLMRYSLAYTHSAAIAARAPTRVYISTGLWFDATSVAINVTSTPAGAVVWRLIKTDGAVALPGGGVTRIRADVPLACAVLEVSSVDGAGDARVAITVASPPPAGHH